MRAIDHHERTLVEVPQDQPPEAAPELVTPTVVGQRVVGTVVEVPRVGVLVDLGEFGSGFIDALRLPDDSAHWPPVGAVLPLEVVDALPDRPVHLRPVEQRYRNDRTEAMLQSWRAMRADDDVLRNM